MLSKTILPGDVGVGGSRNSRLCASESAINEQIKVPTSWSFCTMSSDRDSIEYHVVIVGAGPAGLSAAIRLKQMCRQRNANLSVSVLAAAIGLSSPRHCAAVPPRHCTATLSRPLC
ncbi:hypothetical protein JHK85_004338 [Glycine max]|nr:hypothetical protein JHK85_004338 [Glycine max]KAG5080107.1 hypothetical protein JHK86_004172 [Glycine max]